MCHKVFHMRNCLFDFGLGYLENLVTLAKYFKGHLFSDDSGSPKKKTKKVENL